MVRCCLQRFRQEGYDGLIEGDHSGRLPDITLAIELFLANCLSKSPRNFKVSRPTWNTIHLANNEFSRCESMTNEFVNICCSIAHFRNPRLLGVSQQIKTKRGYLQLVLDNRVSILHRDYPLSKRIQPLELHFTTLL